MVKWFIENWDPEDKAVQDLITELQKQNIEHKAVTYPSLVRNQYNEYPNEDCVVFYGSLGLGAQVQRHKGWVPGVYCNFDNMRCEIYYSHYGKYLLNQDYAMFPILELQRRKDELYKQYGIDDVLFMRPDAGAKPFYGNIYPKEEFDKEIEMLEGYYNSQLDSLLCVISSPKPIDMEWRFVIGDKKVITGSLYKEDGVLNIQPTYDEQAAELAQQIASEQWQPDRVYTADICLIGSTYRLLEINSFSCSGLYACDVEKVVREVTKIAEDEYKEYEFLTTADLP